MKITFPAMKAKMGTREYYSTTMSLSEIPRFFKFNDWQQFTPELRAQRVLNESRVPLISKYITDNEDDYIFSSITCSYSCDLAFEPISEEYPDMGQISLDLENMEFVINDGQHRCAAIAQAIQENPTIAKDKISVLLFPMEDLPRMQQMFSDLNRHAQKSSKSLNILYDQRDPLGTLTTNVVENIDVFKDMVDFEKVSLPIRSHKLLTLTSLYDANKELVSRLIKRNETPDYEALEQVVSEFWQEISNIMTDWKKVASGQLPASALRQEQISTHSVVLRAIGSIGGILLSKYKDSWKEKLAKLSDINWRKSKGSKVNPLWDGVCITAGSVVSNKQARVATLGVLTAHLDIKVKPVPKKPKGAENKAA